MDGVLSVRNKARSKPRHVCSSLCLCSSRTRATASPVFHSSVGDTRTRQRRLCGVLLIHQDWLTQDATASLTASSLNKATGLYEKAYAVVTRFSVIRQGNDPLLKTLLAICVNLAHCYDFGHGNIVMAHRWRTPLRELVDMAVQGGLFTCTSTGHDAQVVYRFFFLSHALLANYARPCANAA